MFSRALALFAVLLLALPGVGQVSGNKIASQNNQAVCQSGNCKVDNGLPATASLPSVPTRGKWEVEDFRPSSDSVSCAVVKYDSTAALPKLHLLCPGPEIFAPLRVHLSLTWKDVKEIPSVMRRMLVDTSRSVKFKSKLGDSRAELTLHDAQSTQSIKQWISFTDVNVGLVLPQK
jgi:hypothetical protein